MIVADNQPETNQPTIEDIEFGIIHSLALVTGASDKLSIAGFALTNPHSCRRHRLLALRHLAFALDEAEHRIPLLRDELRALIRHLDPQSEMLGGPA